MTTYRIVHSGDSISAIAWGVTSGSPDNGGRQWTDASPTQWRNLEYGRDAYTVGLKGWASTASIWPLLRDRSEPNGWIVVQDNGFGVSDSAWEILMTQICGETPSDRGLVVVLPGFRSDVNGAFAASIAVRARIMREVFATHPSVVFIHLDQYLRRNPAHFPDGQHPNPVAAAWLRAQIDEWAK